jgi:diguanylate cyclase (GGDEF)-like protein/PAS domain S-box-containing protein
MKSLLAFFERTNQADLNFFGKDVKVLFWGVDLEKMELYITEGSEAIYGYSSEEISGTDLWYTSIHPDHKEAKLELKDALTAHKKFNLEYEIIRKDGSVAWIQTKGHPIVNSNNEIIRFNGFTLDVTSRKNAEKELADSAEKYQTLVENSAQAVYISQHGKYQYVNKQMSILTDYSHEELLKMSWDQLLDEASKELILKRISFFMSGKENEVEEIAILQKTGESRVVELRSSIITYKGEPALMGTLLDITEKKQALDKVRQLAYVDELTGLPNRNRFYLEIDCLLKDAERNQTKLAVLFVDLDQFKVVNDTYGHSAGDRLIKEAAMKVKELMPPKGFIARYGGDEFVGILPFENEEEVEKVVGRMIQEVPLIITSEISVGLTAGISYYPEHGTNVEALLRFADIAMYNSKQDMNRNRNYSIYNPLISANALKMNKLMNDLQKGLDLNQFHLVYQPKVVLASPGLCGIETLIRWEHPQFGNISPIEFIPLAEKSGAINRIGLWVLERAIQDILSLQVTCMLSVNISPRQLLQEDFVEVIEGILKKYNYPPERLNLEITESVAVFDMEKTISILTHLQSKGILTSLDDFGTGYSSLSYLTKLPINYLKIDQSFVRDIERDDAKRTIIKAIIEIARNLGMKVIAEGIETKEQAELLKAYKCDMGQGYYFSKPLNLHALSEYIAASQGISGVATSRKGEM